MKKYISIIAVFFAIGIAGCKKDFLSLEVNPNAPSVSTPGLTLTAAESIAATIVNTSYSHYGIWGGYWTPSGNYVPSATLQQYQFTNVDFSGVWTALYANANNFNNLIVSSAKDPSQGNFGAIAMIMKAYDFQQLVDNFNDVPYTQAFKPSTILFPSYDKGQDIYNDLVKQLDAAIALINKSTGSANPGSSDIIYAGNMTNWKKFANTLKLRLAIRQSNLATNAAKDDLAATASEGYIDASSNAVANPGYSNAVGKQSPFYGNYGNDANGNPTFGNVYYRASDFAVNLLSKTNDPRLGQLYDKVIKPSDPATATPSVYRGNIFGDVVGVLSNSYTSPIGPGLLKSAAQDAVVFSAAESYFLQSEAVVRGYIAGDAKALYESGVTASFTQLGLTAAQATAYLSQPTQNVNWDASSDKIQAIITQKWIALNGYNNLEAYNEYRRTGFPNVPSSIDPAVISTTLPRRIFYPLSELTSNGANLAKEGTINQFTSKIFWDTK